MNGKQMILLAMGATGIIVLLTNYQNPNKSQRGFESAALAVTVADSDDSHEGGFAEDTGTTESTILSVLDQYKEMKSSISNKFQLIARYKESFYLPRSSAVPEDMLYNPSFVGDILKFYKEEQIHLADSLALIPRDAVVLSDIYQEWIRPLLPGLIAVNGDVHQASLELIRELLASFEVIFASDESQVLFEEIQSSLEIASADAVPPQVPFPSRINLHSCEIWSPLIGEDCTPEETWFYSFWYRRQLEGNSEVVYEILQDIDGLFNSAG